jgi:VanZ family protein
MKRYLAVASFFAFILFVIVEANQYGTNYVFNAVKDLPFKDKIAHFSLYGFLGLLLDYALRSKNYKWGKLSVPVALVWVMSFAVAEEISQYWIPARNCDWKDALADLLGVLLFIKVWRLVYRKIKPIVDVSYKPTRKNQEEQK